MEKKYIELDMYAGESIESVMKELKDHEDLVCVCFKGKMLYSDVDDIDSAYLKVTGKSKDEYDTYWKEWKDRYNQEERKHKESIPQLTIEWIEKGRAILDEKYMDFWIKCVPIRLDDLYRGLELGYCLDIVKELNSGCSFEKAKEIVYSQGHSGMSFGLICSMLRSFCDRGDEFVIFLKEKE